MSPSSLRLELRLEAEKLRRQGFLFSEIASKLGLSKSTIHDWVSKIELTKKEQTRVNEHYLQIQKTKVELMSAANRKIRLDKEAITSQKAEKIVYKLHLNKEELQLVCALLFWCEGNKDISSGLKFTNSDPIMIEVLMSCLRKSFDLDESKFRALVHLHDYHDPDTQLRYWSDVTKIPLSQFHKYYLKKNTGKNKHPGYPGCVNVRYNDKQLGLLLQMLYTSFGNKYRGVR
ncbi:MAG: hypothetical protein NTX11_00165 [Candidatus Saccharibacteria bacterium]|nr:hypothetical protein [Candidatus Saccharibacteria bacterium]